MIVRSSSLSMAPLPSASTSSNSVMASSTSSGVKSFDSASGTA